MYESPVYISLEFTPNPNTLKYSVNRPLLERGAMAFTKLDEARGKSPLAEKLFAIPGIEAVMIGRDFVTITKSESGDWDQVHQGCSKTIEAHLTAGEEVVTASASQSENHHKGGDSVTETRIREILDSEIRPAVAMDGGDITFEKYEDGVVYVFLQGSCSGCPSSTLTLKMGIENRLKQEIPEIREVVSV